MKQERDESLMSFRVAMTYDLPFCDCEKVVTLATVPTYLLFRLQIARHSTLSAEGWGERPWAL